MIIIMIIIIINRFDLKTHVTKYYEHSRKVLQLKVEGRLLEENEMFHINNDPYLIGESDMKRYSKEASADFFYKKRGTRQVQPGDDDLVRQ